MVSDTVFPSPRASPRRVLIVLHGAIGDVVRAMPLAMRVRRHFPEAWIGWAVEPAAAPLLEDHPAIDALRIFDRPRGARDFLRFLGELRRERFDLVLDLQRHLKSGVVSRATGAPVRIGFHRRNTKEGNWIFNNRWIAEQDHWTSKLRQYLAFGETLGIEDDEVSFGLAPTPRDRARVSELLAGVERPFVAAFVGSTWKSRQWFPDATAETLAALRDRFGLAAVLLGAPAERELAETVASRAPAGTRNLAGRTGLRDLVGLFTEARVAFGPDSGPMHIADAVGCPVVSLWGATSPLRSAPRGAEDLALVGEVDCHPCYLRQCPIGRLCMQRITPEAVTATVGRALERTRNGG